MQKIKGTATAAIATSELEAIVQNGRGRDANKARRELTARSKRTATVAVFRGPLDYACPHCGAAAGHACVTASGQTAKSMHKARIALAT